MNKTINELVEGIVTDTYIPTIEDLIKISGNEYLDITIPDGIKVVKYYYELIQIQSQIKIDESIFKKVDESIFEKVNTSLVVKQNKTHTHMNTKKNIMKTGIRSTSYRHTPIHGHKNVYQPIMVAGAYKGTYSSEQYVLIEHFKEYLKTKLDFYKTESTTNNNNDDDNYITCNNIRDILKDIFYVNNEDINNKIKNIINNVKLVFCGYHSKIEDKDINPYTQNDYDIKLSYDYWDHEKDIYIYKNDQSLLDLLCKKIYGYFNSNIYSPGPIKGGDDVLCKYYPYINCIHITAVYQFEIFGMQKLIPILSSYNDNNLFSYLIIMNFLRLRYKLINYVNINIKNDDEERMWKWGLGRHILPSGNLSNPYPSNYFHLEIIDMLSFTIRDAIYVLKLFETNNDPILFHCAAGFGRTGSNILLLTLAKTLCSYLRDWRDNGNIEAKQNAIEFCTKYLCEDSFNNMCKFLQEHYNDNFNTVIDEIFKYRHKEEIYHKQQKILICQRMNTIKVAILYYITKQNLYIEELNIPFNLNIYQPDLRHHTINYNLNEFIIDINKINDDIYKIMFRCDKSKTKHIADKDIIFKIFPDTLDEIGPDLILPIPIPIPIPKTNIISNYEVARTLRRKYNSEKQEQQERKEKHNNTKAMKNEANRRAYEKQQKKIIQNEKDAQIKKQTEYDKIINEINKYIKQTDAFSLWANPSHDNIENISKKHNNKLSRKSQKNKQIQITKHVISYGTIITLMPKLPSGWLKYLDIDIIYEKVLLYPEALVNGEYTDTQIYDYYQKLKNFITYCEAEKILFKNDEAIENVKRKIEEDFAIVNKILINNEAIVFPIIYNTHENYKQREKRIHNEQL
jgi:hypothetical protein